MPERSVSVAVKANVAGFVSGIKTAQANAAAFNKELQKSAAKRQSLTDLGNTAGKVGFLAAAGLAAAVASSANFDKAMSSVQAATHESAGAMQSLREAALKAGADTAFSATEAAAGIESLAKAGVSTQDILGGGLSGALDLAAAGTLEVADAADIAATALTQFKLSGEQVPHVADLLAAAAGKAQGEVTDMGMALKQSGLVASQVGLTIEETTGTLAAFAKAGLIGSDAGTSFKTMLQSLTPSGAKAKSAMDSLGISAYDAQGNFVGMTKFAGSLQKGLEKLSVEQQNAAMKTIFGSDAVRAASVVFQNGEAGIQGWIDKVNDSGYAAETAAIKLDNLAGDWEAFMGSLETALIGTGSGSQGPLRGLVQGLTDTTNAFNDLPGPMKDATSAGFALAAVLGGGMFVGTRVASGLASTTKALTDLGMSAEGATKTTRVLSRTMGAATGIGLFVLGLSNANETLGSFEAAAGGAIAGFAVGGPWGAAIGGAAGLLASFAHDADDGTEGIEAFTAALNEQTGALTENNRVLAQKQLQDSGAFDAADQLGIDLALVTDAALGNTEAMNAVIEATSGYGAIVRATGGSKGSFSAGFNEDANAAAILQREIGNVNGLVDLSSDKFKQNAAAAGDTANGIDNASGAAGVAAPKFEAMSKALIASRKAAAETGRSFFNLGESLDDGKVSLKGWIHDLEQQADALKNFRLNAEKAANKGLRQGLIAALQEAGPAGAMRLKQLANATDKEIGRANRAWRAGERQIDLYTDAVGGVPKKAGTNLTVTGVDAARAAIRDIRAELANIPRSVRTDYYVNQVNRVNRGGRDGDPSTPYYDGGYTGNVGRMQRAGVVHGQEFVVNADATAINRPILEAMNASRGRSMSYQLPGSSSMTAELARLRTTVDTLTDRLASLGADVAKGAQVGAFHGTAGRIRAADQAPYLVTGGI